MNKYFKSIVPGIILLIFNLSHCDNDSTNDNIVEDIDGNIYNTVTIGEQVWMVENLKVTHYQNGDSIPNIYLCNDWITLTTGAYCYYDNDSTNVVTYGRLYNWYTVDDDRKLAPLGWHIPTDEEWKILEMNLGMSQSEADDDGWRGTDEGGKLKASGIDYWITPNTGATNESGFTALPGGCRIGNYTTYDYDGLGCSAFFWSATEYDSLYAYYRLMQYCCADIARHWVAFHKRFAFSVRCIKD